ncbi:hypothetical protein [uncultured Propionibacterium sp.]|uniref:hypothetical protein n=1 Tax=uncultured Propionibacterium sp. TaxID=218066 RepID=UPI00292FD6D6|nr:hypothetical protein [uncultured Propionibacterium sp.]
MAIVGDGAVLAGDDGGGVDAPEVGELDALLLEDGLAGLPVGLHHITTLPGDLVVGMHTSRAEDALDLETGGLVIAGLGRSRPSAFLCSAVLTGRDEGRCGIGRPGPRIDGPR